MRIFAVIVGVFLFPVFLKGGDSIYVKARMVPVDEALREGMSQLELAALVGDAEKESHDSWMKTSSVARSGEWMTSERSREFWYPSGYTDALLYKSKTDTRNYSIKTTKLIDSESSQVIPCQGTGKMLSKDIGIVLKMKPTIGSNGKVSVEGLISQTALLEMRRLSKPIAVIKSKGVQKGKVEEVSANFELTPLFEDVEKAFSVTLAAANEPVYVGMTLKKSLMETGVVLFDQQEDEKQPMIDIGRIGSDGGEDLPVVLVISGKAVEPKLKEEARFRSSKSKRLYLACRLVETDSPLEISSPILSDLQFQKLIRRLSQKKGVDVLSAPSVQLKSSEEGKVEIGHEFLFPAGYDAPEFHELEKSGNQIPVIPSTPMEFKKRDLGVRVNFVADILSNGRIGLQVKALVDSFEGFVNYGNRISQFEKGAFGKLRLISITENRILGAVFSDRSSSNSAIIPEGYTVALSSRRDGSSYTIQERTGPFFGKMESKEVSVPRYLTIFVTAQLVDAEGLPLRR